MPKIEFEIHHGEVKIDAIDFKGSACEAATKEVEEALGAVIEKTRKPEYYGKTTQRQNVGGSA